MIQEALQPIVSVTPSAAKQIGNLLRKKGNPDLYLRIGVKGGGCSGLSYVMSFEEAPGERDQVYEQEGLRLVIDKKSAKFLEGVELDYTVKNLLEGGWKWSNPNAARSCGCGTSFTPK